MSPITLRLTVQVAGTSSIAIVALLMIRSVMSLQIEPWLLIVAVVAILLVTLSGFWWTRSAGEQGPTFELTPERLAITNLPPFAQALANAMLQAYQRRFRVPRPYGSVGPHGPAARDELVAGGGPLPTPALESTEPVAIPPDAVKLP